VPSRRVEARAGNGDVLGISRRSWSTDVVAVRPTSTERSVEPLSRITMAERTSGKWRRKPVSIERTTCRRVASLLKQGTPQMMSAPRSASIWGDRCCVSSSTDGAGSCAGSSYSSGHGR
jgi:hypothetical protein